MIPEQFRRDRIGVVGTVNGAEILPGDWSGALNRITAVEIVASAMNKYPLGLGGSRWISPQSHGLGGTRESIAVDPSYLVFTPIFVSQSIQSLAMCVEVTVPQPGAQVRLGLYDANRQRVQDFGVAAADTAGWKVLEIVTPATLATGMSHLAIMTNNVAGVEIRQLTGGLAMYHSGSSIMVPVHGFRVPQTFGAMPAVAALGAAALSIPLLGLRLD